MVEAYAYLIREVLQLDGCANWLEPLGEMVRWMATDELKQMEAGVELFLVLFQDAGNSQLYRLAPSMLPKLFHMFAQPEVLCSCNEAQRAVPGEISPTRAALDSYVQRI